MELKKGNKEGRKVGGFLVLSDRKKWGGQRRLESFWRGRLRE